MFRFVLLLLSLCASFAAENHVILITIDGFPGRMLTNSHALLPNIRALAAEGASSTAMKVSNPSVTWPNHTTLVTGVNPRKHSVLFNGVLVRGGAAKAPVSTNASGVDPLIRKYDPDSPAQAQAVGTVRIDPNVTAAQLVAVPTLFDIFHNAGLTTAGVNWPCTRSSKSLDDDFPDSPNALDFTTPRLREDLVGEKILASPLQKNFALIGQPQRDEIWTQTASYLIRNRMPVFMAFHLLNTDSTHHKYGPETMASFTALAMADRFVGDIVAALKTANLRDKTTIFITADHGFASATNVLQPNVVLREAGLLQTSSLHQIVNARVQCVSEGGSGLIYLNNPATREEDRKKVIELFSNREGVADLIGPDRFEQLGMPPSGSGGMGDFILRPKLGYAVSGSASGTNFVAEVTPTMSAGYHGYISEEPLMNAVFVASGRGVKKGVVLEKLRNIDVAPTIARLFGQKIPDPDGRVLTEILGE